MEFIQSLPIFALLSVIILAMYLVIKSADYFVDGAGSLAHRAGMSTFVIGLTIVAIGTSAPELFVNIIAATSGATELSIGNILGSNIANILLALGISTLFMPLVIHPRTVWKELPYSLLAGVLVLLFGTDLFLSIGGLHTIGKNEGLILLTFFILFIVYTFRLNKSIQVNEEPLASYSTTRSIVYVVGGILGLVIGGDFVVESATALATHLGMSQNLIGLTVIAIGTSLPEIATSVTAVRKGLTDMVVGGIIGSNIFNIFLVLGITSVITPLSFSPANIFDTIVLIIITIVFWVFMFIGKRNILERWQGVAFIFAYIAYIIFAVLRG